MNKDTTLKQRISEITRRDLETTLFPFPELLPLFNSMVFVRILKMSRFWDVEEQQQATLNNSVEDLITGLHGQQVSWLFMLQGSPTEISCWYGLKGVSRASLHALMRGTFSDSVLHFSTPLDNLNLNRLQHACVLTGTPSPRSTEQGQPLEQIEKLCRALYRSHWSYIVYSEAIPSASTIQALDHMSLQIRDIHATHLLQASPIDQQNRLALRLVELLEAKLARFEQGRTVGMWSVYPMLLTTNEDDLHYGQGLLQGAFSGPHSLPAPVHACPCQQHISQTPPLEPLTSLEAALYARPPLEEYPGYELSEYVRFGVSTNQTYALGSSSIAIGDILDRGSQTGNSLIVPRRDLSKHALIVGVTGSGKTNTCFCLLEQIWNKGRGAPFLVIESAKSEYRALIHDPQFADLKVFTVGDETVSPLRLNPFEVPDGILIQSHIDYLQSLFAAAFVLYPPMPYVLALSIQEIYEDRGWDLAQNANWRGIQSHRVFPTLSDLTSKIEVVIQRMEYSERIAVDLRASLLARVNQLRSGGGKGMMLNTRHSVDNQTLFQSPCLLELKNVVSDDEKAFIIGLLLIRLYEFYEAQPIDSIQDIVHVTLIEEAHRLLRNVSTEQGSDVSANPRGRAIEVFANILSEIRAFGEGIVIAEQVPVKLTPDAIKNTNLKIIHRLVAEDDRVTVGSTMNLTQAQLQRLSTLRAGEGIAYTEGMLQPSFLKIPLSKVKSEGRRVTSQTLRDHMKSFWEQHPQLKAPLTGCGSCPHPTRGNLCTLSPPPTAQQRLLQAFHQLFHTFYLNKALTFEAYSEFYAHSQRSASHAGPIIPAYCLFVGYIERELERRGEFLGWMHRDVEHILELACFTVLVLATQFGKSERKVIEKTYSKGAQELYNRLRDLHQLEPLPYIGCNHCQSPCSYRFAMQPSHHSTFANTFQSTLLQGGPTEELSLISWNATWERFFAKDIRAKRGAALCFAIQQINQLDLTATFIENTVVKLTTHLSSYK